MVAETPTYPQYTNKALGEGTFDQLMAAVKAHLKEEFDQDRIDQAQWGQVYIQAMEAAMGNSTQFILGMLLIDEKRDQLKLQNELIELEKEKLRFQIDYILPLERDKLQHEINKLAAEIIYIQKQAELIDSQILVNASQIEVNDSTILTQAKQREKIDKEIEFLDAKIQTEKANTIAGIAATGSLIGHQMALLQAQKLGFSGDLYNKVGKVYADYDSVFLTVHENPDATLTSGATDNLGSARGIASSISSIP